MTLIDYVNHVCTKMHRVDAPSKNEARMYCRNRYQTIYDSRGWRDATSVFATTLNGQVKILPYIVDRVLACRWGSLIPLVNEQLWTILTIDPTRFEETGDPVSFSIYSPSGVLLSPGGGYINLQTATSSPNFNVSIYGSKDSEEASESVLITGMSAVQSVNQYDDIYTLSKSDETHDLMVRRVDTSGQILYLRTHEKERKHQRIHFHSAPQNASTGLVLCKRKFRPILNDHDAPELSGIEVALLAFLEGDMLESQRHFGKAQLKYAEAAMAVQTMADMERHQSANIVRIIPFDGGDYSDIPNSKSTWWS